MWVLLFLLSVLVRLKDRRRMALVAGTFVLVSGAVYFAFMAAWLNVFLAVGLSDAVRIGLATLALLIGALNLKDFAAPGHGPSLSIPAAARPGLVARMHGVLQARALPAMLLGVAALAVVVNFIELLCTAGLPAIYTAVLTQYELSAAARYAYLGLYIVGYIADDSLMVGHRGAGAGQRQAQRARRAGAEAGERDGDADARRRAAAAAAVAGLRPRCPVAASARAAYTRSITSAMP